jgi:threonine dehydrogenase-like Zn-dependent dehydrogenase
MFALPESMTFVQGAPVEPTAVAVHAVSSAPLRPGDRVLVTSGGTIGQLAALAAVAFGAGAVVLSEPSPTRRARAAASV